MPALFGKLISVVGPLWMCELAAPAVEAGILPTELLPLSCLSKYSKHRGL